MEDTPRRSRVAPGGMVRYEERNALRANWVERAEDGCWSSVWCRRKGSIEQKALLSDWPLAMPRQWCRLVNRRETEAESKALRRWVNRGQP